MQSPFLSSTTTTKSRAKIRQSITLGRAKLLKVAAFLQANGTESTRYLRSTLFDMPTGVYRKEVTKSLSVAEDTVESALKQLNEIKCELDKALMESDAADTRMKMMEDTLLQLTDDSDLSFN